MKGKFLILLILTAAWLPVLLGSLYTVAPGDVAIITQFGKIVGEPKPPGRHFKIPFIHEDHHFSAARIYAWQGHSHRIPTMEKKFVEVTPSARWKIVDPVRFFKTVYRFENANMRVGDLIHPTLRSAISSRRRNDVVSEEPSLTGEKKVKPAIKDEIVRMAGPRLNPFGITLIDLDIRVRDRFPE